MVAVMSKTRLVESSRLAKLLLKSIPHRRSNSSPRGVVILDVPQPGLSRDLTVDAAGAAKSSNDEGRGDSVEDEADPELVVGDEVVVASAAPTVTVVVAVTAAEFLTAKC